LAGYPEGHLTGGIAEWQHGDTKEYRMILGSQTGTGIFRIISPFNGIQVDDVVNVSLGCNRTLDHCQNRFNNLINYGGFPYVPIKSPFGGTMLY
jgi:hypothetical protein